MMQQVSAVEFICTARVVRTPIIYPAYEKTEIQAATRPAIVFPSFASNSPNESKVAPNKDINTASITKRDFFSLKKNIIARATAKGYIKCIVEATPLAIF